MMLEQDELDAKTFAVLLSVPELVGSARTADQVISIYKENLAKAKQFLEGEKKPFKFNGF